MFLINVYLSYWSTGKGFYVLHWSLVLYVAALLNHWLIFMFIYIYAIKFKFQS